MLLKARRYEAKDDSVQQEGIVFGLRILRIIKLIYNYLV